MKSKIASKYENKRWYRVVKSIYVTVFILLLVIANSILWLSASGDPSTDYVWPFLITNAIIVFGMGTMEGLFWYIVRGKWGYPKDTEPTEIVTRDEIDSLGC